MGGSGKRDETRNMLLSLPEPLILEVFSRIPLVEQQAAVSQCCRQFRDLVQQTPVLHIIDEDATSNDFKRAISKKILGKDRNSLTELRVLADEVLLESSAIRDWIRSCSLSLKALQIYDDWNDRTQAADLSARLRCALTCPSLERLYLNGSCSVPLDSTEVVLQAPGFRSLRELSLLRLSVATTETLQKIVNAAPVLTKLHLPSLTGLREISIQSQILQDFLVTRVHAWDSAHHQIPMEKFDTVILSTPNLSYATVGDVNRIIDIRSAKLEQLVLTHAASCNFQCTDLSKLVYLEIDASGGPAYDQFEGYEAFHGNWAIGKILSLVTQQRGTLKGLDILNSGDASCEHRKESLVELFQNIASVQEFHVSFDFLENNELEKLWEEQDRKWQDLVRSPVGLLSELEEIFFHCYNKARKKPHAMYIDLFLQTCPKLRFVSIQHHRGWPIWEAGFIRAVFALQRSFPAVEIDLQLPDTDIGVHS